ncbi:uncharacterized protein BCR38DRAFT_69467 [Pseudomassariella vexata]|uniref:Uncharacterized protein n=1 Tax=Pseudomassariella vexata TaxID=1141098 RepID=A0A1Y2DHN1_9PEZI|nr:uncharacterized protein BCR38DRAFT_69467 [Pseudomassariella vexata]ORY58757.1 hypothetical protein BCR38DRAFT_69467 [Pseudomassariella vexata]
MPEICKPNGWQSLFSCTLPAAASTCYQSFSVPPAVGLSLGLLGIQRSKPNWPALEWPLCAPCIRGRHRKTRPSLACS